MNPQSAWVRKDVPELRIIDDALRQAVKARQSEPGEMSRKNIEGGLKALERRATANALNATHTVIPGLGPGIHDFGRARRREDVDGRAKPGHDVVRVVITFG